MCISHIRFILASIKAGNSFCDFIVGEAFRLPRDGEPVPYKKSAPRFEERIRYWLNQPLIAACGAISKSGKSTFISFTFLNSTV